MVAPAAPHHVALAVFLAGTMVATVYLGWHFAVDVPAGLAIAALAWVLGPLTVGVRRRPRPPSAPCGPRGELIFMLPSSSATYGATVRFILSWVVALALLVAVLPRAVDVSWTGLLPVLGSVHWPAVVGLLGVWFLGLYVHAFVLTAAAPSLTHRRAITLNLTGSAVSNVVPLGGAAGVELNRRMMRAWGIDGRAFAGYTFLTNLWDVGLQAAAAAGRGGGPGCVPGSTSRRRCRRPRWSPAWASSSWSPAWPSRWAAPAARP